MRSFLNNTNVRGVLETFYLNKDASDVNFLFNVDEDVQKIPANKTILALHSPVFYAMFYGSLKEKKDVEILDADADSFKEFLRFFYHGEVTLTMENIETIFRLADKYEVLECINACAAFLKSELTLNNICWGYELALLLENKELIDFCEGKITFVAEIIFATDVFQRCEKSTLKRILQLELRCKEIDIFDACLMWAKNACKQNNLDETQTENLKSQLGDCLNLIRLSEMTTEEFSTFATSNDGLFTSDEFNDIMSTLTANISVPKKFKPISYHRDEDRLWCGREWSASGSYSEKYFQNTEVVWFTSNQPLLFYKFETRIMSTKIDLRNCPVNVTITEIRNNTSKRVLYEESITSEYSLCISADLTQLIPILPQFMYEIRLTIAQTGLAYLQRNLDRTVKLENMEKKIIENDYTIQFHRDPFNTSYDIPSSCIINYFLFYKI